jgi:hypothetical protein
MSDSRNIIGINAGTIKIIEGTIIGNPILNRSMVIRSVHV